MFRFASRPGHRAILFALVTLGTFASLRAEPARADLGTVEVHTGALRLERAGEVLYRPVVRGALSVQLLGPLHLGGYVQLTGERLPLQSPDPGGGGYLAIRPRFELTAFRPAVEIGGGRLRLPVAFSSQNAGSAPTAMWTAYVSASLGIAVADAVTLEVRGTYNRYFGVDETVDLSPDSFALALGLTIHIP